MKCVKCGKRLKNNEKFCTYCGYYNDESEEKNWNEEKEEEDLLEENWYDDEIDKDDDEAIIEPVKKEKKTFRIKMPKCPAFISRNDVLRKIFEKIRQKGKYIGIGAAAAAVAAVIVLALHLAGNTYRTPIRVMENIANIEEFSLRYHIRLDFLNGLMAEEAEEILG
jgi:hypothetical protein